MGKNVTSNIDFYYTILELLNQGKNPSQISDELNVKRQNIYYYTTTLKELGFIRKEKSGEWIVLNSKRDNLEHAINWKDKKIRGHAFIWTIKPKRKYDWKLLLEKNNIQYNLVRGYIPRLMINGKKVWLGKESITVYETKSFYGKNAIESRKYAVYELQETIRKLMTLFGIQFSYYFKPTREHFGMIKNELARQCNKSGEKIIVRDTLDGNWLWIDDSYSLGELETGGKGFTKDRTQLNMEVQNWYNDHKRHNFKVTPTFLLESINKVTQNQLMFNQNFESHVEAIQTLSSEVKKLKDVIKELKKK